MDGLLWFLLVGLIAGWLASNLMKGRGFGFVGDMVVGVIGAVIGGHLFGRLGMAGGGLLGSIIVATIGAVILIVILRLIRRV
jgi:uncharacterized membrane protein YeaQ/YmgE (transglycosylase-associated protein family)